MGTCPTVSSHGLDERDWGNSAELSGITGSRACRGFSREEKPSLPGEKARDPSCPLGHSQVPDPWSWVSLLPQLLPDSASPRLPAAQAQPAWEAVPVTLMM